jgi:hypothetical protein
MLSPIFSDTIYSDSFLLLHAAAWDQAFLFFHFFFCKAIFFQLQIKFLNQCSETFFPADVPVMGNSAKTKK